VGSDGKKVDVKMDNGKVVLGSNASNDLKRLVGYANAAGSKTALNQIMEAGQNETKIHVKIVSKVHDKPNQLGDGLLGLHQPHNKNGKPLKWDDNTEDFKGVPAYVEGKEGVYKEATVTVFEGNIEVEPNGNGNATANGYSKTTKEEEMVRVFQHELHHDTDKIFIQDLRNQRDGKPNKNIGAHDNIYLQDDRVYMEIDKKKNK